MKKLRKWVKLVPVVTAVVILNGQQLNAFGTTSTANTLSNTLGGNIFAKTADESKQTMYLMEDTNVMENTTSVSGIVETDPKGSLVHIISIDGPDAEILTSNGNAGYVPVKKLTERQEEIFNDTDELLYTYQDTDIKKLPYSDSTTVDVWNAYHPVHVTGRNNFAFVRIEDNGNTYYVDQSYLVKTDGTPAVEDTTDTSTDTNTASLAASSQTVNNTVSNTNQSAAAVQSVQQASSTAVSNTSVAAAYNGAVLNPMAGTIQGPSGRETYYNLNMSGCIANMRALGNNDPYYVRADGVKMLGNYVMVAADFATRPLGSIVETSLGTGIVVDTGSFALSNPNQIDVAVTW